MTSARKLIGAALLASASTLCLAQADMNGRANGMIHLQPGGRAQPTQPVQNLTIPKGRIPGIPLDSAAEPMGALGSLSSVIADVDKANVFNWTASRSGTLRVTPGGTFTLDYLSVGKPSYERVALLFTSDPEAYLSGKACEELAGGAGKLAAVEGQLSVKPAEDKVVAAAKAQGMRPAGKPLYLVQVVAPFNGDLAAAAALKKKAAVRAFPLGPGSTCLKRSSGAYVASLTNEASGPIVIGGAPQPKDPPAVAIKAVPVGWAPPIETMNCSYIIYASVSDPAWEEVLKLRKISRAVGTRFTMCQSEFTTAYNNLSDAVKAKIAIKNALGAFTGAFNWTALQFQSVASTLASPLKGLLPPELGGKFLDKAADMLVQSMMGQLPGSPLTGDLAMVVNQGCAFAKAKLGGAAAEQKGAQLSGNEQAKTDNAVQQLCNGIQNAMMEKAKANTFLQYDLTREPRRAIMYLRVSYLGMNGAAQGMMSKESGRTLTVQSYGGPGPYAQGNGNFPQVVLMRREVTIPAGAAGTSAVYPFSMDYAMDPKTTPFTVGATAYAGMRASSGGYPGDDLKMKSLYEPIQPPAQ